MKNYSELIDCTDISVPRLGCVFVQMPTILEFGTNLSKSQLQNDNFRQKNQNLLAPIK